MEIGTKIRVLRLLTGKMQRDLACELGMKAATHINRWEKNISTPKANMLQRLGDAFEINWPWLQDSNFGFSKESHVFYRPLSPYEKFSPRWLALLPHELGELLPDFWRELGVKRAWGFRAPCGGGVAILDNGCLTIVVICRPEITESVLNTLPFPTRIDISDSFYASILIRSKKLEELFTLCGITSEILPPKSETARQTFEVSISYKAKASLSVDQDKLYEAIKASVQKISTDADLEEEEIKIRVTPPRSVKETTLDYVDPLLKKLAELAWAE
jgi:transcriptional regulator with XRE-family HTH domain/ribosome-associated translation inhibitor RaiA